MAVLDEPTERAALGRSWIWWLLAGILALAGGVWTFFNPVAGSLAVTFVTGGVFLALGVVETIAAIQMRGSQGFLWKLVVALATVLTGVLLLANPLAGMVALTIVVGAAFGAMGVAKIILSLRMRPRAGWGWMLASGLVSLALAIIIFADFPASAATILGILLAVELIQTGIALMFAGLALRRLNLAATQVRDRLADRLGGR
jgi:uncharacterized membrane protein HdeD (DUF308 family)